MNLASPLQRTVTAAAIPSCSRIPHIRHHILRKQFRNGASRKTNSQRNFLQARPQSTLAIDESVTEDSHTHDHGKWKTLNPFAEAPNRLSSEDPKIDLIEISRDGAQAHEVRPKDVFESSRSSFDRVLQRGDPDEILLSLATTSEGGHFITEATDEEFERAVCALDTSSLIEPFRQRQWFSRASNHDLGTLPMSKSLLTRMRSFEQQLDYILERRLQAGHRLTLPVCRSMLHCAGSIGSVNMAQQILSDLMPSFSLQPDLSCYNSFLHSLNWNRCFGESARFNLRITQWSLGMRSRKDRLKHFRGYTISGSEIGKQVSIRNRALNAFQKLVNQGLVADESTFTSLMVAMAREGDITAVESILKSVWHIDVAMLEAFDEEEVESPTFYEDTHHLRPSKSLLFAVMHSYCINGQPGKAWTLIDYISRNYNLIVPKDVLTDLSQWAFVMSRPRSSASNKYGLRVGQLPLENFENLYAALTDEPYNLEPDQTMLSFRTRLWQHRHNPDKALDSLRQAVQMFERDAQALKAAVVDAERIFKDADNETNFGSIYDFRRKFLRKYLEVHSQMNLLRQSIGQLIQGQGDRKPQSVLPWMRQQIPQLVEEFICHLNDSVTYKIDSGKVTLWTRPHRQAGLWEQWADVLQRAATIWAALDVDDASVLSTRGAELSRLLKQHDQQCRLSTCIGGIPHEPEDCPQKAVPEYIFAAPSSAPIVWNDRQNTIDYIQSKADMYATRRYGKGLRWPKPVSVLHLREKTS